MRAGTFLPCSIEQQSRPAHANKSKCSQNKKTRKKAATLNRYRSYTHTDCVTEEKRRCLKRAKPHTTTSTTWRMQTVLNVVAAAAISSSFHLCLGASLVRSKHKLAHDISLCLSLSLTFEFRTLNPPSLVHNTNRVLLLDHPPHASFRSKCSRLIFLYHFRLGVR